MANLGTLTAKLGLDSSGLDKGAASAEKRLTKMRGSMNRVAKRAGMMGVALGAAGAAITAHMVKTSATAAREIQNLAQVSGASTRQFQRNAAAAKTVGIEQGKLADVYKDMNDRVGDFISTGAGPMADFFENIAPQVGVTADQFRKLSGPDALQLYVDSLEKANLSQAEMTFYMEAMASDSSRLLPLLRSGGAEMGRLGDRAERLGLVLSDIEITQLEQANVAMDELGMIADSAAKKFSANLAPAIEAISEMIAQSAEDVGGMGEAADSAYEKLITGASFVMNAVDGIKRVFELTADAIIGNWSTLVSVIADRFASLLETLDAGASKFGVDVFGDAADSVRSFADTAGSVADQAYDNMSDTLNRPLAGDMFRKFEQEARESGEKAAQAIVDARDKMGGGEGQEGKKGEAEKERERQEARLNAIRAGLNQEFAIQNEHNERMKELEMLRKEGVLESDMEFRELQLESQRQMNERLKELEKSKYNGLEGLAKKHWSAEQATAVGAMQGIASTLAGENKKMFEANKAFGIADALVSTYQGIASALKLPFPANLAAAAQTAAVGFQQVSAIKSQSFGGGGGGGSAGGASGVSASSGGGQQGGQQQQQPQRQVADVTFNVSGGGMMRDLAKQLVEPMNDLRRDGYEIGNVGVS